LALGYDDFGVVVTGGLDCDDHVSRALRWDLTLLFGAGGLALLFWSRSTPPPRLPSHLVRYSETWPGQDNVSRDEFRALGSNTVPALVGVLNSRSIGEILWIQRLLGHLPNRWVRGFPDGIDAPRKRHATVWLLGELGPDAVDAIPSLEWYAQRTTDFAGRTFVTISLAKIQPDNSRARSNFWALLSSPQQFERFFAAREFAGVPVRTRQELAPLFTLLSDTNHAVQSVAALSLVQFGPLAAPAVEKLRPLLTSSDRLLSLAAACAMASVGPEYVPESLPVMTNALAANAPELDITGPVYFDRARTSAAAALPYLEALSDASPGNWPDRAMIQVSPVPSEKAIRRLADHDPVEPSNIELLASMGPAARVAVPQLRRAAEHPLYANYRELARKALERIEGTASAR
jgi:hypothetical protein